MTHKKVCAPCSGGNLSFFNFWPMLATLRRGRGRIVSPLIAGCTMKFQKLLDALNWGKDVFGSLDRVSEFLKGCFPKHFRLIDDAIIQIREKVTRLLLKNKKKVSGAVKLMVLSVFAILVVVGSNGIACIPALSSGVVAALSAAFGKATEDTLDSLTERVLASLKDAEKKKLVPQGTARCLGQLLKGGSPPPTNAIRRATKKMWLVRRMFSASRNSVVAG